MRRELLKNQIDNLEEGLKYHHYENVGTRMAGVSSSIPEEKDRLLFSEDAGRSTGGREL